MNTSRTFLKQNVQDQTAGKPKFKGQQIELTRTCLTTISILAWPALRPDDLMAVPRCSPEYVYTGGLQQKKC